VPNAEADFAGKCLIIRLLVNLPSAKPTRRIQDTVFISYIDVGASTKRRRSILKKVISPKKVFSLDFSKYKMFFIYRRSIMT
jgi:hypothetical protein